MYVYVCVCIYIYIYLCMYVCMYVCMCVWENKITISFESEDNFKLKVKILCKSLMVHLDWGRRMGSRVE